MTSPQKLFPSDCITLDLYILQDGEGETPIHICAEHGLLGLAQTLCAFGCNVDVPNEEGMLPLHLGQMSKQI